MPGIIEAGALKKYFGSTRAVNGIEFSVSEGEIFGIVGPDGSGKTTTVRLCAGVMEPTSGMITVGGFRVPEEAEKARNLIGYMPQKFSLYEDLSVEENINFFADLYMIPKEKRRERILQLYRFSRLEEFKTRLAGRLSGGMQKKLALTCALINFPKILILDEPTIGGDPLSREELWSMLVNLNKNDGISVLVTTSYMDEVDRFDRVALIYKGSFLKTGRPSEIAGKDKSFEDAFIENIKSAASVNGSGQ